MLEQEAERNHHGELVGDGVEELAEGRDLVAGPREVAVHLVGERDEQEEGEDAHGGPAQGLARGDAHQLGNQEPQGHEHHPGAGDDVGGGPDALLRRQGYSASPSSTISPTSS